MNTNKKCTVYRIVCDIPEDRVVYIGKTTQPLGERLSHHATIQRKPTRLNKYINEVGKEHFRIEEIDSSYDHEAMAELERVAIVESGCLDLGFNVRIGSRFTEEDRLKSRSDMSRNKPVKCVNTGKVYMSASEAARYTGETASDVILCCNMKIRQSNGLKFVFVDIPIERYESYWNTGIKRNRPVICVETGVVYKNTVAASKALGISPISVNCACCARHFVRKLGVHLEWLDQCAVSAKPATPGSGSASCETSSMQVSTRIDGSQE